MPTEKISASLTRETLAAVRARVGPRSVSSYLEQAVREKLERDQRRERIRAYLAELEAADPIPPRARARAQRLVREEAVIFTSDPRDLEALVEGHPRVQVRRVP